MEAERATEEGAMAGQNALRDEEAIRGISASPTYCDPACPESEHPDLAALFAQRGHRWAQLALGRGITAADRRFRTESRAEIRIRYFITGS